MTEQQPRHIELTNQANSSNLGRGGDIFMPDGSTGSPENPIQQPEPRGTRPPSMPEDRFAGVQENEGSLGSIIRNLEEAATPEERHARIMTTVRGLSPQTQSLPPELLNVFIQDDRALDYLVNRIISQPLDSETSAYQLSFYGGMNLEAIKDSLRAASELDSTKRDRYEKVLLMSDGVALFHQMNSQIIAGKTDEFIGIAANVSHRHFKYIQDIAGVSQAMRVYEQQYTGMLSKDERITTESYKGLRTNVRDVLRNWRNNGLLTGESGLPMEDWEIERAVNLGRTFFNISFRGAELISLGQLPVPEEVGGEKRYASFPQESAARLMNWMVWMTERFKIAGSRGGVKFLEMVKANYRESLRERGLKRGVNQLTEFGGIKVEDLEMGSVFGISGIYSSWRLENMALPELLVTDNNQTVTVRQWLDQEVKDSNGNMDLRKNIIGKAKGDERLRLMRPLIDSADMGLGILLRQSFVTDAGGYEVRKAIWEKVASGRDINDPRSGNITLLMDYLNNFKMEGEGINTLGQITSEDSFNWSGQVEGQTGLTHFDALKQKLLLQHEINMKRAVARVKGKTLDLQDIEFNPDEARLIIKIKQQGAKLAEHLADIVFPFTPFMNDAPFELLDYSGPGEEFYKRRTGGDLPSYHKAQQAFVQLMNNPGGVNPEDALKLFDAMIKGVESPQSTEDAQVRLKPLFSTWLDFIMTKEGMRQSFKKAGKEALLQPTSIAQEFAGVEALSLIEPQIRKVIDDALLMGIIDLEQAKDEKKKKHADVRGILWAIFRDLFWVPITSGVYEFGKRTVNAKV